MKKAIALLLMITIFAPLILTSCKREKVIILNVYNWGEYISDGSDGSTDTNKVFEKYINSFLSTKYEKYKGCRVKVNYTTYDTNENMYSKLASGAGDGVYDVIFPSEYMIQRMADEGLLHEYDVAAEIPYYQYINQECLGDQFWDPEHKYSVPYTYGMVGIIYNAKMMDERDINEDGSIKNESWALLWNEGCEGDYEGKILQFNNPRDAFGTAMYYLGIDVNSPSTEDWEAALELLKEQKPLLQGYVNDEIFDKMTTGSAAISAYYAGDYVTMAADAEENYPDEVDLRFYYPKEGTNVFVDAMCIPESSQHKEIAKEYINFMLMNSVLIDGITYNIARDNAEFIGYASPNNLVRDDIYGENSYLESIGEDAYNILYGQSVSDIKAAYGYSPYYQSFTSDLFEDDGMQFYVNSLWEDLKTSTNVEPWVHITSITIIAALLGICSYSIYIKKKRSAPYRSRDRARSQEKT